MAYASNEKKWTQDEYNKEHIPNAIFFDLDKNSKIRY